MQFNNIYKGKRVAVLGHTGFKGSWLALWLKQLGAEVAGFSNEIPTTPSHFELANLSKHMLDVRGDITNYEQTLSFLKKFQPEIVFHLAANAIVYSCIEDPQAAFMTNTVGTINVLEALRHVNSVKAAVIITSDKCYENVEWEFGYRETDRLGGKDPYSASKACAELAFSSYFRTYLQFKPDFMMASARAGNVIGGGDWAKGRIITDCINAWTSKNQLLLKNPHSTRPWQHVMEPLSGYLSLAQKLLERKPNMNGESFNFGPKTDVTQSVLELIVQMQKNLPELEYKVQEQNSGYKNEAQLLKLSCDRAYSRLGWQATLSFEETVELTASWYQQWHKKAVIESFTISQINNYCELAKSRGLPWT